MVVVAIMAILAALAGPSFAPLIERWRVRDAAETLTSSLYYARSEAIKRGGNVIIQANTGTDWSTGWRIFFDANANGSQDTCVPTDSPNECDLQVTGAPTHLAINLPGSAGTITVDRWGMMSTAGGAQTDMAFELMPKDKAMTDSSAAKLCAGKGGRIARIEGSKTC